MTNFVESTADKIIIELVALTVEQQADGSSTDHLELLHYLLFAGWLSLEESYQYDFTESLIGTVATQLHNIGDMEDVQSLSRVLRRDFTHARDLYLSMLTGNTNDPLGTIAELAASFMLHHLDPPSSVTKMMKSGFCRVYSHVMNLHDAEARKSS